MTNLLQRFEGYKADRMGSTRARGDVCGRSEIRRIKGGFRVSPGRGGEGERDTLDSLVTSFAKQSGLERRIPLRFGADFAIRGAHAASLEPQWGKRVKNLSSPSLPPLAHFRPRATKLRGRCTLRFFPLQAIQFRALAANYRAIPATLSIKRNEKELTPFFNKQNCSRKNYSLS